MCLYDHEWQAHARARVHARSLSFIVTERKQEKWRQGRDLIAVSTNWMPA